MSRAAEPEGSSATESASPKPTSEIATGDELPEVAAISQTGANVSLRGFPDRVVLLFLCQSIASTRCTNLAAALSERFDQVRELDAAVIGVTADHRAVLRESAFELELPYYVLADPERRVSDALGIEPAGDLLVINQEQELYRRIRAKSAREACDEGIGVATSLARESG